MERKTMTVAELKAAIAGLSDEAVVLIADMDGNMVPVAGVDEFYKGEGVAVVRVEHYFPDGWFVEDEDGTRRDILGA